MADMNLFDLLQGVFGAPKQFPPGVGPNVVPPPAATPEAVGPPMPANAGLVGKLASMLGAPIPNPDGSMATPVPPTLSGQLGDSILGGMQQGIIGKRVGGPEVPKVGVEGIINTGAQIGSGAMDLASMLAGKLMPGTNAPQSMMPQGPKAQSYSWPDVLTQSPQGRNQSMVIPGPAAPEPRRYSDFVVGLESGGNPTAQNPKSSAGGLGQFIDSTWVAMVKKHHPEFKDMAKDQIIALKHDPALSREMIDKYGDENGEILSNAGFSADNGTKYLAHLLGPGGAVATLRADPSTPIKNIIGEKAYNDNVTKTGRFVYGETAGDVIRNIAAKAHSPGQGMPGAPQLASPQLPGAPTMQAPQLPGITPIQGAQLPGAPTLRAPVARDFTQAIQTMMGARPVDRPTDPRENITRLLMGLASGAADAKGGIGSVLAGAAGSGTKAASNWVDSERARHDLYSTSTLPGYMMQLANFQKGIATGTAEDQNAIINTGNTNLINRDARGVEQAKIGADATKSNVLRGDERSARQVELNTSTLNENALNADKRLSEQVRLDADTTNKNVQLKHEAEINRWKASLPQVHATDKGITIQQLDPNTGSTTLKTMGFDDLDKSVKKFSELQTAFGRGDSNVELQRYVLAGRLGGEPAVRREMIKDMVERNSLKEVLGAKNYKEMEKDIQSSIPAQVSAPGSKDYKAEFDKRAVDVMMKAIMSGKLPDDKWIPQLKALGNPGAALMMSGK